MLVGYMIMKSFMKYPGSKQLMMSRLLRHLPKQGECLVECFAGSCSVALNTNYERYLLNDANPDLIHLYRLVQYSPEHVIAATKGLFTAHSNRDSWFYAIRRAYNESRDADERAFMLLYLSRHCFNGLIRYSSKGDFNTPFGDYTKPYFPEREVAEKLENAVFSSMDFREFLLVAAEQPGEKVCYADPPYLKHDSASQVFTAYTKQGFSLQSHVDLNRMLFELRPAFVKTLLSNHDGQLLTDTYNSAMRTVRFRVQRTISAKTKQRKSAPEVLLYY